MAFALACAGCDVWLADEPPLTAAEMYMSAPPRVRVVDGSPASRSDIGETFPEAFAASEAVKPRPLRPPSISLGYVGDAPLTGGVMRDPHE